MAFREWRRAERWRNAQTESPPRKDPRGALVQVRFSSRKTASSAGDAFLISMKAEAPETKKKKHPR